MTLAFSRPRGYRSSGILVVVATWIWVGATYGQSSPQLQVPVQVLQNAPVSTYQPMMALSGYYSDRTQVDPLSHYQRTRLGRWKIAKDVDRDDKAFGIQLETPVRTIRVRCETTINGKPFRVAREKTIDEYLEMAKNAVADAISETAEEKSEVVQQEAPVVDDSAATKEVKAEEADAEEASQTKPKKTVVPPAPYVTSSNKIRLAKYARSRGDLLTRHELRRRLADISGGPALLRTADNFGTQRHETMTLFAFLDTDGDGAISQAESGIAVKALAGRDLNSDKNVDLNELQLGLNSKSASRKVNSTKVSWQSWDATESEGSEDLSLEVAFSDDAAKSNLTIGDTQLDESWDLNEVELKKVDRNRPNSSSAFLSHPKVSVVFSAVQPAKNAIEEFNQVSIGVALESNALFRAIDHDGNWILSTIERRSCSDVIASLDTDSNGTLEASELPVLLRVCVGRGATAHEALLQGVSIIRQSELADQAKRKQLAPEWFKSMDKDGDLTLTRSEFLGTRQTFHKMDANENEQLSVEEVLESK